MAQETKKRLCAVCDSSNQTTYLCPTCKKSPYNVDWQEQPYEEVSVGDMEAVFRAKLEPHTHPAGREDSDLAKTVMELFDAELHQSIVVKGRREPFGQPRKLKTAEIAQHCGCTQQYVLQLRGRYK